MKRDQKNISRRRFLGTTLAGTAGLLILPGFKAIKPSDTIRLGFIGLGRQAMFLLNSFLNIEGVSVVAGCDVYGIKRRRFEQRVRSFYESKG
ncbi:MAG TPA: twin-arginine translocation signal domain-containing protein, partial [Bacteroidales bacterium]|nr:twin-arginine translocation signal domain-containing protein [Bacteroidales bacterium]